MRWVMQRDLSRAVEVVKSGALEIRHATHEIAIGTEDLRSVPNGRLRRWT